MAFQSGLTEPTRGRGLRSLVIRPPHRPLMAALATLTVAIGLTVQSVDAQTPVAQVSAAGDAGQLEEIVVTAQFRQQNLQETPVAITAITADMARERGAVSLTDLGATAPNVTFSQGGGIYPGAQMYIRGVGQENFIPAQDPGVGVYINDVYYGNLFGADFDLLDLDRVEILRGPQGTLAGANTIGGAVKLYTKAPSGDGGGYFEAGYGTDDTTVVRGAFDVSLVPDTVFLRVSGALHNDNGYVTRVDFACAHPDEAGSLPKLSNLANDCRLGQEGGRNVSVARADLRWLVTDRLNIDLSADVDHTISQPSAEVLIGINSSTTTGIYSGVFPFGGGQIWQGQNVAKYGIPFDNRFVTGGQYITYSTFMDTSKNVTVDPNGFSNNYGYEAVISYKFSDTVNLKSITAFRKMTGSSSEDADGSPFSASTSLYTFDHKQFTQEFRLSGTSFGKLLDWTAGVFFYDANDVLGGQVDSDDSLDFAGGLYFQDHDVITSTKDAAYLNLAFHPIDKLTVTGGYRYSRSGTVYTFGRINPNNPLDPIGLFAPGPFDVANVDGTAPESVSAHSDYRVAVDYQWTPDLMTYASVATGFKDGGINPTPTAPSQEVPFAPERLTSYEIGLKSDFFDHRTTADFAAFYSKYKNLQENALTNIDGELDNVYTNAGSATIDGLEAELEGRPVRQLLFTASGSYLHFKYDSLGAAAGIPNGLCSATPATSALIAATGNPTAVSLDGCTNVLTPEFKASLAVQYEFDLGRGGKLTPRFSDDYTSKMYSEVSNLEAEAIPQHWVANARLNWQLPDSKWEATLLVTNVFDKYYYTNVNPYWYQGGYTAMGLPGRPREALFTVRRTF
jgi:iron complex outermembrane receptor protein